MPIQTYPFNQKTINKLHELGLGRDWPAVYILENGSDMYVGQTGNTSKRFKQHYIRPDRRVHKHAHVIIDEEFNMSATHDIESWLIQYLVADDNFELQNGNHGLSNHNYYDKQRYLAKFEEVIWPGLQSIGIAKQDLIQIRNTDLFKYSPYKSLTDEQIEIVDTITDSLLDGEEITHVVNGEPGTGKSVLATFLMKYLTQSEGTKHFNVALVVPQAGLRKTLQRVFSKIKGLKSSMVIGPSGVVGNKYDMLIVDEAHRLRRRVNLSSYGPFDKANKFYGLGNDGTQLDWIMRSSHSQVLLYDGNQSVVPGDIRPEKISGLALKEYKLTSQLRIIAGNDYIKYIDDLLSMEKLNSAHFPDYDLRYFTNIRDMVKAVKAQDKKYGLARVVAGYAWSWKTKDGGDYDIDLDGLKLKWNSTNIDWVNSPNAVNEVGCIHTVQGYDLNYVGVIIGPELSYDLATHTLHVDKDKYMDFNGKRSIESIDELKSYILNIYKTLLTRGIKGTYVHAVDPELGQYLSNILI